MDIDILYVVVGIIGAAIGAVGGVLELRRGTEHDVRPLVEKVAHLEGLLEGIKERLELLEVGYREPRKNKRGPDGRFQ